MALGLMTVINVIAIIMLTPTLKSVSNDYESRLDADEDKSFDMNKCKVQGTTEEGIW